MWTSAGQRVTSRDTRRHRLRLKLQRPPPRPRAEAGAVSSESSEQAACVVTACDWHRNWGPLACLYSLADARGGRPATFGRFACHAVDKIGRREPRASSRTRWRADHKRILHGIEGAQLELSLAFGHSCEPRRNGGKVGLRCLVGHEVRDRAIVEPRGCLLYTSPSPRDLSTSRMPSSA